MYSDMMLVINSSFGKSGAGKRIWQAAKTEFLKISGADFAGAALDLMAEFKR
jgi:hypothetical protein